MLLKARENSKVVIFKKLVFSCRILIFDWCISYGCFLMCSPSQDFYATVKFLNCLLECFDFKAFTNKVTQQLNSLLILPVR